MSENDATATNECTTPTHHQSSTNSKKTRVPEVALPDLIRLIHGNVHGRRFLVKEFMTYWSKKGEMEQKLISKASLLQKIREIGTWRPCPEEGPMHMKACWYIPEETRKKYIDEELPLPNKWSYCLTPKKRNDFSETAEKLEKEDKEKEKEKKSVPLITQFTKKITQEEMKKQLIVKSGQTTPKSNKTASTKPAKRATLISVGRGEQFSKSSKENLLKTFTDTGKSENKDSGKINDEQDDVIILDSPAEEVSSKNEKNVESVEKKKTEDRLDTVSMKLDKEAKDEEKVPENAEEDKNNAKVECNVSAKNIASSKDAKGTVDTSMEVDN